MYRSQRHIYDLTRRFFLLGRERLLATVDVPEGGTVLEIGCGTARNLIRIAHAYPSARLFGLDVSDEMLKSAAQAIGRAGLANQIRVSQGDARLSVLRRAVRNAEWSASAGATVGFSVIGTEHRYSDPSETNASFFAVFATVGPDATVERYIAGGSARFELDAPIAGVVDRAYSAARTGYSPLALRRIGPGELRGVDAAVSYSSSPFRRVGVVGAYRFGLVNYHDAQPLRVAAQSLSIGVSRQFGGVGR